VSHGFARRNFASAPATVTGWQRPEEWLALPRPNVGDHKAVGLFAVTNGNNYVAIECSGQFAVDWGDGLGPQAYTNSCEKNLGWGDYSASTLTSRGYRQAVVTVTPRGTGVFDGLDFSLKHSAAANNSQVNWLDVIVSGPNISTASLFYRNNGQQSRMLEQFELVGVTSQTSMTSMFQNCSSLQSVPALNTANVVNMTSMFYGCYSLQSVPALNTANVTNMTLMFQYCYSLQSVPALNTANVTNMSYMFQYCSSLQSVPALNTANVTSMSNMFQNCSSLRSVELAGCVIDIAVNNCRLEGPALNALYTSLGTPGSSRTINVTGNPGTPFDNPTIATAKGWTVTGS